MRRLGAGLGLRVVELLFHVDGAAACGAPFAGSVPVDATVSSEGGRFILPMYGGRVDEDFPVADEDFVSVPV
jgi:hypothetical protein